MGFAGGLLVRDGDALRAAGGLELVCAAGGRDAVNAPRVDQTVALGAGLRVGRLEGGLVVAIAREGTDMTLIEANRKKSAFLLQAAGEARVRVRVVPQRIEAVDPFVANVVSARALTALAPLIGLAQPFFDAATLGLFPKGKEAAAELEAARREHTFTADLVPSRTVDSAIVRVTGLRTAQ